MITEGGEGVKIREAIRKNENLNGNGIADKLKTAPDLRHIQMQQVE